MFPELPQSFWPLLLLYHFFPLHFPLTLKVFNAPFGRFASKTSKFNLNGQTFLLCIMSCDLTRFKRKLRLVRRGSHQR